MTNFPLFGFLMLLKMVVSTSALNLLICLSLIINQTRIQIWVNLVSIYILFNKPKINFKSSLTMSYFKLFYVLLVFYLFMLCFWIFLTCVFTGKVGSFSSSGLTHAIYLILLYLEKVKPQKHILVRYFCSINLCFSPFELMSKSVSL